MQAPEPTPMPDSQPLATMCQGIQRAILTRAEVEAIYTSKQAFDMAEAGLFVRARLSQKIAGEVRAGPTDFV